VKNNPAFKFTNMAKSILDFWKQAAADITDTSKLLDTSAILDTRQILDKSEILGIKNDEQNEKNINSNRKKLKAHFVLCTSELNANIVEDDLTLLAFNLKNMVNGIFDQVLGINTEFNFSFCAENKLEDGLNFTSLEDFEDKRNSFNLYNFERFRNKKYTNNKQLDRGIKVIEILPETVDLSLHSNAEKSGIVAHVYLHHLIKGGYRDKVGATIRQYNLTEFDITIIHEICHLFGLSDRYQFVLKYKLGNNGDCLESINQTLIPIPIDPALDEEGLGNEKILNNLMFGADDFCLGLTNYQKNVILGEITAAEPDYDKVSVLINVGSSFSTNSYNNKAKKRIGFAGYRNEDPPIIGADSSGIYTYSFVDDKLVRDYTGQNIKLNGKPVGNKLNDLLPIVVLDVNDNVLQTSNDLGLEITNKKYCDSRTINPVISNSHGN
jgi:hypothetical protein